MCSLNIIKRVDNISTLVTRGYTAAGGTSIAPVHKCAFAQSRIDDDDDDDGETRSQTKSSSCTFSYPDCFYTLVLYYFVSTSDA